MVREYGKTYQGGKARPPANTSTVLMSSRPSPIPANAALPLLFKVGLENFQIYRAGIADATLGEFRQPPVRKIRIATYFSPRALSCE
jgi:hypothetical protein